MKKVKLSIVVPVYNVEKYIDECLKSLVNQTVNDYEIIVVNDGSTDNSLSICENYKDDKKIKIFTKENGGLSSARNYGIDKAKGEYIAFVDSDDWVVPNYVETIIMKLEEQYDVISFNVININDGWKDGTIRYIYNDFDKMSKSDIIKESLNPSFAWARVYKSDIIKKYKFPKENYWYEDMATVPIILSYANKIGHIDEALYYYRQRKGSITSSNMNPKSLGFITALENSLSKINQKYRECFLYAMYRSIVTFIYFKPEYSFEYLELYHKYKEEFDNNCYIQSDIKEGKIENLATKELIPKKIHYFWFGHGKKGELFQKCYQSWKEYAPDFEIIEWNESNCDVNECDYVKEAYENKKWAFVADYFRIKILKEHGGIYVDTDVEFKKHIHCLLLNKVFFAFETNNVNAAIFGCVPNANIINEVYNSYLNDKFINEDGDFKTFITIPIRLSKILKKNTEIKLDGHEQLLKDDIKIYSADVLTVDMYNNRNIAEHHYEATWWDAKYGIQSYKYNVLQYYFGNVADFDDYHGIMYHLKCIFRKIIPLSIRKGLKKILGRG